MNKFKLKSSYKIFFCLLLFTTLSCAVKAQLANTKWKGILKLENDVNVRFDFGKDILAVKNLDEGKLIETMTYKATKSTFTLVKITGQSDCDNSTPGKYKYSIKGNMLSISLVEDACEDRSNAIKSITLTKTKL